MIELWLAALEGLAPIAALRVSQWAYPLVNALHILGIGLLLGSILPLDLRLIGLWSAVPVAPLWTVLTRCAATGLLLAVASGVILFATSASEYARSPLFLAKMPLVAAGAANALLLRRLAGAALEAMLRTNRVPRPARFAALVSMSLWLSAMLLGRLVAYA